MLHENLYFFENKATDFVSELQVWHCRHCFVFFHLFYNSFCKIKGELNVLVCLYFEVYYFYIVCIYNVVDYNLYYFIISYYVYIL